MSKTNLQKAKDLINNSKNRDFHTDKISVLNAILSCEVAAKTDWFYPSKNEFPKDGEKVWVSKFNPIRKNKEMGFDAGDKDFWIKYIEAWCYLPTL